MIQPASTALEPTNSAYLESLGRRVRQVRARRGMSRRILAEASGVSERYLAQLESGKGNASIMVLRAIASAMHTAVDVEYLLLRERLRNADEAELKAMREALRSRRKVCSPGLPNVRVK